MDSYKPFQDFIISAPNYFRPNRYEEYQNGQLISSGNTSMVIEFYSNSNGEVICNITSNNLSSKMISTHFDKCMTLQDRILMLSSPQKSNANILFVTTIRSIIGYTCDKRNYKSNEPVVGSIYTNNGRLVKMSFTMSNPERLMELYI